MPVLVDAEITQRKLRLALQGPAKSGKTFTALAIAHGLTDGRRDKIALIDSERNSACFYAKKWPFRQIKLESYGPLDYINGIRFAEDNGFDVLIIDSLSHAWAGENGALDMVEKTKIKNKSENSFLAWRNVTPVHNRLVDTIVSSSMHIIATLRVKVDWVLEEVQGKKIPRKVGLAPIQREGLDYEFDVLAEMHDEHILSINGSRFSGLDGLVITRPNKELGATILRAMYQGEDIAQNLAPLRAAWKSETEGWSKEKIEETIGCTLDSLKAMNIDGIEMALAKIRGSKESAQNK